MKITTRSILLVLFIISTLSNCVYKTKKDVVKQFNSSYNSRDFETLKKLLSPDLLVIDENNEIVCNERESYIESTLYTEVFDTKWIIKEIKKENGEIVTLEADSSSLNQFLYGKPLEFNYEYTIEKGEIKQLKYNKIVGYEILRKKAEENYQTLFKWIAIKYPSNLKLASESSVNGAEQLKKLIELYNKR